MFAARGMRVPNSVMQQEASRQRDDVALRRTKQQKGRRSIEKQIAIER